MSRLLTWPSKRRPYVPREQVSPSGLSTLARCGWLYAQRYIFGIKEDDPPNWWEVRNLKRPEKPEEGASAHEIAEHREAVQEYNRLTRRSLGQAIHHVLQVYFDWHPPLVDVWQDEEWAWPCAVVTAGLDYLPDPKDCKVMWLEEEHGFNMGPAADPLRVFGFLDFLALLKLGFGWLLVDYKSTYNLDYAVPPDELRDDVQACSYALAVMVEHNLQVLACRWIYFSTDEKKPAAARAVDFTITRAHAVEVLEAHEERALEAREGMRNPKLARTLPVLQPNPTACGDFGGCVYHADQDGPCNPPKPSKGEAVKAEKAKRELLARRRAYWRGHGSTTTKAKRGAKLAVRTTADPRALPSSPHSKRRTAKTTLTKGQQIMAQKTLRERLAAQGAGNEDEDGTDNGGGGDAPAKPRGRKPKADASPPTSSAARTPGPRKNVAKGAEPLYVSFEPSPGAVEIPSAAPLHGRVARFLEAILSD